MTLSLENNFKWLAVEYQQTNIQVLLQEIGKIMDSNLLSPLKRFNEVSSVDSAFGVWLDYVGYRYGIFNRPSVVGVYGTGFGFDGAATAATFNTTPFFNPDSDSTQPLDDEDFREFIKAKAGQLVTDCTPFNIYTDLLNFFEAVLIQDTYLMGEEVKLVSSKNSAIVQAVIDNDIVTKPAAVFLSGEIITGTSFGFSGSLLAAPFNSAPFVNAF